MSVRPEEVWTIQPTQRVLRLREVFVNLKPKFEIERARILTQTMKETEGEPMVIRRAKAFRNICRQMPLVIAPDELFVGYISETRGGVPVVVEYGPPMETVLNYKGKREFVLTPEDEKILREEIIPYWKGNGDYERTPWGYVSSYLKNSFFHYSAQWPAKEIKHVTGGPWVIDYGHQVVDYEQVLEHGFLGIKNKAEQKLKSLDPANPDHLRQIPFVRAIIIAMEGAAEVGLRFAAKSREMAEKEKNKERKADLLRIAECCEWVPANPARTFYEALQAVYFTWYLQLWESQESKAVSMGHPDQYLMKYYMSDIWEGRLTKENAQELIDCFLLSLPQVIWKGDDKHSYVVGDTQTVHVSVGGYKADGGDACNELSYMFIEGVMHLRLPDPNLSIQMHTKTPEEILIKGVECVSLGGGQPMFVNADTVILGLLSRQHLLADDDSRISLADARTFAEVGCNEPFVPGKDGMDSSAGMFNVAMAMDLALNNGVSRIYKTQIGPKTGDPRQFTTFEEVKEAFCIQLKWMIKSYLTLHNVKSMALADLKPTVFASSLLGCLEKGKPREAGGCCYNSGPGIMGTGIPDCADSLTAVKKVVFEDKSATMTALIDALDNNFNGCEILHQELLSAPKYGTDNDDADEMMKWVTHFWATEVMKHKNTRGGRAVPGVMALYMFAQLGLLVGALPSGRKSGDFLSNGISPCNNAPTESPTQVINSLAKVDNVEVNAGNVLNMTLDPSMFDQNEQGIKRVVDLLRGVIDQKIFHIQFNVLDVDTLRAAQREPEKHKDVIVRLAGYSTYFVALIKEVQDEIINRKTLG